MENRAILAAVLMAALLVVYQVWFMPAPPPEPPPPADKGTAGPGPAPPPGATTPPVSPPVAASSATPPGPAVRPPQRTATVETPLYRAVISSEGGKLQEWVLHYRGEKSLVAVGELGPQGLTLRRPNGPRESIAYTLGAQALKLGDDRREGELVMRGDDGAGIRVTDTARFHAATYTIDRAIRLENTRAEPQVVEVVLPWIAPVKPPEGASTMAQWPSEIVWASDGAVHREYDLGAVSEVNKPGEWIGFGSLYYFTGIVARSAGFKVTTSKPSGPRAEAALAQTVTLAPGQTWDGRVEIYAGPKEYDRLKAHGLEGAIDFGGFPLPRSYGGLPMEWLGVPVLWLMHFFYRFVGNYGIAIILLTVITKVLFYPLTVKSMSSMKKMQAIQPQVNALRAKYKSDPQEAQRRMMELYRKEGVNPIGGCLPMLIQVPIFYALYVALSVSVELQNAPFICFGRAFGVDLWICDLASYDPTYVLPIIMGVTMFIQQKMTPTMGDPRQAKMMLVMPFIFTFMFFNLPSGLVLYWSVSNVLQILQQWLMNRSVPPPRTAAREAKDAVRA